MNGPIPFAAYHELNNARDLPAIRSMLQHIPVLPVGVKEPRILGIRRPATNDEVTAAQGSVVGDLDQVPSTEVLRDKPG